MVGAGAVGLASEEGCSTVWVEEAISPIRSFPGAGIAEWYPATSVGTQRRTMEREKEER